MKYGSENLEDPVLDRQFIESAVEPIQHPRHLRRRQQAARAYYVKESVGQCLEKKKLRQKGSRERKESLREGELVRDREERRSGERWMGGLRH